MSKNDNLKQKTINGIFWKGLERLCAQAVSLIVSIVLARILLPEDYSVISIANIFFAFCNLFITEGINSALIQKKDADSVDYSTVLVLNMGAATILYIAMFLLAPLIAKIYNRVEIISVIRIMALTFFIHGYKAVLSAKISSEMKFKKYFSATIGGISASAIIGIVLAMNGAGVWALVAQKMSNEIIDSLILTFVTKIKFRLQFSYARFKSLFSYGGKIFFASIVTTLYNQAKPLIVGLKFSTNDLAFYNKGESFPSLINSVVNSTLTTTIFPAMAKCQDSTEAIRNITHRYISVMSYLLCPILLGFFSVSDNFVSVILTEKWNPIVPYIKVFCIAYMLDLIQIGNINAIKALGRSDLILKMEIIKKSLYAVVILSFVLWGGSPIVLATSTIICNLIATVVNIYPNRKLIGYGYRDLLQDMFPNLIISVVLCICVSLMNYLKMNLIVLLALQIVVGILLFLGLSIITKNQNFKYILHTLCQKK